MTTKPEDQGEAVAYPDNDAEFEALAAAAARVKRDIEQNEKRKKDRIAKINAETDERNQPLGRQLERMATVLVAYTKANRKRLTKDGKRQTIETADAIIAFRKDGVGTLEVDDEAAAIAVLEKRPGGKAFVKVEKSLIKDPLKKFLKANRRRRVKGVRLVFQDSLRVELTRTAAEKSRGVKATVLTRVIDN